uniref:Uncharacterized protein n=1 Tax=viral metagenome TaxID=1070528 RepID=A0A6H1ZH97_9ZZZZ
MKKDIIQEFIDDTPAWIDNIEKHYAFSQCTLCGLRIDKLKELLEALKKKVGDSTDKQPNKKEI